MTRGYHHNWMKTSGVLSDQKIPSQLEEDVGVLCDKRIPSQMEEDVGDPM